MGDHAGIPGVAGTFFAPVYLISPAAYPLGSFTTIQSTETLCKHSCFILLLDVCRIDYLVLHVRKPATQKSRPRMNPALCRGKVDVLVLIRYVTCNHRLKRTRYPVCSAISKLQIARLVLHWVTMRESLVLQVLFLHLYIYAPSQLVPLDSSPPFNLLHSCSFFYSTCVK